jgi:hypothetical protein
MAGRRYSEAAAYSASKVSPAKMCPNSSGAHNVGYCPDVDRDQGGDLPVYIYLDSRQRETADQLITTTFTGAGFKGIAGLSPESLAPHGVLSDGAGGTLRGPPAQMDIHLFNS